MSGRTARRRSLASLRGSRRSQSTLVGVVIVLGLAATMAALIFVLGGAALDDVRTSIDVEDATQSMREVNSRLSQVAYGNNDVQTLSFGAAERQSVRVESGSYFNLTINGSSACRIHVGMGALVQEVEDGPAVAYEGGGIWHEYPNASVMVSPPDLQYRNGTINFPVVNVSGAVDGSVRELRASKNVTESQLRSRELREVLNKPQCRPPDNATITIKSQYFDAWARYLQDAIGEGVTVDAANQTVSADVIKFGGPAAAQVGDGTIQSNNDTVVEVRINGTGFHTNGFHLPISFEVEVEGQQTRVFGPDGIENRSLNMSYGHDDMNNPLVAHEHDVYPTDTISVPANTNFSVVATSYSCNENGWITFAPWDDDLLKDTGPTLPDPQGLSDGPRRSDNMSERCFGPDIGDRVYKDLSSDDESQFLQVYNHSDNMVTDDAGDTSFDDGLAWQRTPKQVLGDVYNQTDANGDGDDEIYLDLKPNQAVYLYELEASDLDSADFNDAIVIITLKQAGAVDVDSQFVIHISMNSVQISAA